MHCRQKGEFRAEKLTLVLALNHLLSSSRIMQLLFKVARSVRNMVEQVGHVIRLPSTESGLMVFLQLRQESVHWNSFTARVEVFRDTTLLGRDSCLLTLLTATLAIWSSTLDMAVSKVVVKVNRLLNFETTTFSRQRTSPSLKVTLSALSSHKTS